MLARVRQAYDWVANRLIQTSFLLAYVVWTLWFWGQSQGVLDFILSPVYAVITSACTFWLGTIALLLLAIPVKAALSMFDDDKKAS